MNAFCVDFPEVNFGSMTGMKLIGFLGTDSRFVPEG
jgi:hypothetical protein